MNWKEFVLNFVADVDYDRAKDLDPATAEMPEDAREDLSKLIESAKKYAELYLGIKKEEDQDSNG